MRNRERFFTTVQRKKKGRPKAAFQFTETTYAVFFLQPPLVRRASECHFVLHQIGSRARRETKAIVIGEGIDRTYRVNVVAILGLARRTRSALLRSDRRSRTRIPLRV